MTKIEDLTKEIASQLKEFVGVDEKDRCGFLITGDNGATGAVVVGKIPTVLASIVMACQGESEQSQTLKAIILSVAGYLVSEGLSEDEILKKSTGKVN